MFERFTDRSRRVLVLAQEEARLLEHNFIGTEHILLGLLDEEEGVAARALESMGIGLEAARAKVQEVIGPAGSSSIGSPSFTPRAKKTLELALREALQLGHNYIGTEHMLLGIVGEGEGVGAQVLISLGADLTDVRQRVMQFVGERGGQGDEPSRGPKVSMLTSRAAGASARAMAFRGPASGGFANPQQVCGLCGRDLWEVDRYISAGIIKVCDRCITDGRRVLQQAESTGEGPELHLPPRVFGEVPTEGAVEDIVTAFERAFTVEDPGKRSLYAEDDEGLRPYREEASARVADRVTASSVQRLRFLSPDRARVQFSLTLTSGGILPVDGAAVRIDGRWKVSRQTQVDLLRRGGTHIPDVGM